MDYSRIQIATLIGLLLFIVLLFYVYHHYKLKKEQAITLEQKNKQIEEQNSQLEQFNLELQQMNVQINKQNQTLANYNQQLKEKSVQIEEQNGKLERANEELQQYAYVASHDLKEPLRTISAFSGFLQKQYSDLFDEKAQEYFGYIMAASQRMKNMLEDLLKHSKVDKVDGIYTPLQTSEVIKDVISNLDAKIQETEAKIFLNVRA